MSKKSARNSSDSRLVNQPMKCESNFLLPISILWCRIYPIHRSEFSVTG
jgi:hypothetical protein